MLIFEWGGGADIEIRIFLLVYKAKLRFLLQNSSSQAVKCFLH
jgi:hypothetical protein